MDLLIVGARSLVLVIGMASVLATSLFAQNPDDPFDFRDIPADAVKSYYWGLGGGYLGSLVFVNHDGLNDVGTDLGLPEITGPMFMSGGGGFVSALILNSHLRIGFYGMGGSKKASGSLVVASQPVTRSMQFSQSIAAAQIDYAVRVGSTMTIVPGVMIGASGLDLEVTQSPVLGTDRSVLNPDSAGVSFNSHLSSRRIFYYPAVYLEWVPVQVVMLRLGGGYAGTFSSDWIDNNDVVIRNMPDINTNGPAVQFGLFVGLFQMN